MTKEKEVTVEIRQADSTDAALVVDFLNQVGKESDGATIIEWGELIEPSLSDAYLKIFIRKLEDGRELAFEAHGARAEALLTSFEQVEKTDD